MPVAKKAYVSDGINWLPLVSGLPNMAGYATTEYVDEFIPSISVSASPPATPEQGQFWFDTDTNELFVYDSVYWIEVSGAAIDLSSYLTEASASTIYATKIELNNIDALPSQSGNSGKYLTTSGSVASWGTLDLSLYLTQASASTTYLTQSSASTTYATQAALNAINGESDQFILPSQIFG